MKKNTILIVAGFQSLCMAMYHFALPYQFNWFQFLPKDAPTVGWATIALNNYFSFNLLVLASLFLFVLFKKDRNNQTAALFALALALFWVFSAVYQFFEPMPLPRHLAWVGGILQGLAWGNACLFVWGMVRLRKASTSFT